MEIFSEEVRSIKELLDDWLRHPEVEVEATFGHKGQVDLQTFLRVVNRLRSKGYHAIPQQDRLTITLPDHLRFTLNGSANIAQYCRDNRIQGREFIAIMKDRTLTDGQNKNSNIDLKEYNVRIKGRREIELGQDDPKVLEAIQRWDAIPKYFRLIRRWTFEVPGLKYDLSMVRSTERGRDGRASQRRFQDQNLLINHPTYEIEVEIDRESLPQGYTADDSLKALVRGMGDILRGIQGSQILIRNSIKEQVLLGYKELTKTDRFRGVGPVTLQVENMTEEAGPEPNIRSGYNVTDKADGLRVHGFTDKSGELFMIDMSLNVYRTGLVQPTCKGVLLDGEFVTEDKHGGSLNELLLFDIYILNGEDVSQKNFKDGRYTDLLGWIEAWNTGGGPQKKGAGPTLHVGVKRFFFADASGASIFEKASAVLQQDDVRAYHTDGLIFTPNEGPLPVRAGARYPAQFKWKPAEENTIDFLVSTVKDEEVPEEDKVSIEIHPSTGETVRYKTLHLYVGSSDDPAYKDPRATILNMLPLPDSGPDRAGGKYRPIPFVPVEYPEIQANVCSLVTQFDPKTNEEFVVTERTGEPIRDRSIVEMRYDANQPPGWRWVPLRVRADKTERFLTGRLERSLNADTTAQNNWNSIHNPVTEHMIRTGSEVPSEEEVAALNLGARPVLKKYYERKAAVADQRKVQQLHDFHNRWIKDGILYASIAKNSPNPILLDVAVGRGNDMHRWRRIHASFVFGVDATGECCLNKEDGAYRRLLDTMVKAKSDRFALPIPPMFFAIADSSKRLIDGTAGEGVEESDMLRSILGRVAPQGPVAPLVEKIGAGALKMGANAITCMYALHYFFENQEKLNGLLQNIADNLKIGGLFVGTCFDGQAVFDLLRGTESGKSMVGMDGDSRLWEIKKLYDADELPQDDTAFGMAIDVEFISIGLTHKEYLVPWNLLVAKMATIGCEPLNTEELAALGLNYSNNMYEVSWEMSQKSSDRRRYQMNEAAKQYSFLNRWFLFKRTGAGQGQIGRITRGVAVTTGGPAPSAEAAVVPSETAVAAAATAAEAAPGAVSLASLAALPVEKRAELAALSTAAESSPVRSDFMASMVPASGAAAAMEMQQRIDAATAAGDAEQLRELNKEATAMRTGLQEMAGIAPGTGMKATAAAVPGSAAKQFVRDFAAAGPGAAAGYTVPVAPPTALGAATYPMEQVVQFNESAVKSLKHLELPARYKDYAGRHLSPSGYFRIMDRGDAADTTQYPSITHFLAAMKYKYASKRPELAATVFGIEGTIHQNWLEQRRKAAAKKASKTLTREEQNQILLDESNDVKTQEAAWAKRDTKYDEGSWLVLKDKFLEDAIRQRLERDKVFCEIVSAAIAQGKYLLYYDDKGSSDLGGTRVPRVGRISGQNKYGVTIMRLVREMPEELKACLALPDPA